MKIKLLDGKQYDKDLLLDNMYEDDFYYGELSKLALSSSAMKLLLSSPKKYYYVTKYSENLDTQGIRDGRLLHTLVLEPHKFEEFVFVDVASKNTKTYKEAKEKYGTVYTRTEKEQAEKLADQLLRNEAAMQLLTGCEFEVPAIDLVQGMPFRGKADILSDSHICDIKTTTDIGGFKYAAVKYGYDVQAYLYCELFNKQYYDFKFLVIDKGSCDLAIFDVSEEFYLQGKAKVEFAIERYNEYFANKDWNTTEIAEDLDNYIIRDIL
jgi:SNF2 family DNA or RNA helicase